MILFQHMCDKTINHCIKRGYARLNYSLIETKLNFESSVEAAKSDEFLQLEY